MSTRCPGHSRRGGAARTGAALVGLLLLTAFPVPAGVRDCAEVVVVDPEVDPGVGAPTGALLDADLDLPVDNNTQVAGGGTMSVFLSDAAIAPGRMIYLSDLEADPSALGADPNGNPGRGAVFTLDPSGTLLQLVADGSNCAAGIPNCGPQGVFVDPIGVAWDQSRALLAVVDPEADPGGFGPDVNGFAGHGAVFSVSIMGGIVDVIADGSNYPAGIPSGQPSIFQDPVAIDFARDGTLYVVDQLADPAPSRRPGAVFRVDVATGEVTLVSADPRMVGPRDLAVEPSGTLLVVDRLAGANGTLFRIDPLLPPTQNIVAALNSPDFAELAGVVAAGNGDIFVLDASADPLFGSVFGTIFQVDPQLLSAMPVSSTRDYETPWSLELTEPESVDVAIPRSGMTGTSLQVTLTGGIYQPTPLVDMGPGITIDLVTWVSSTELLVDVTIAPGATIGARDVRVINPVGTHAFHCDLFEVISPAACDPTEPIGPSVRVQKDGPQVYLEWSANADPCAESFRVYRAWTARPTAPPGDWPNDPPFEDVSGDDLDGSSTNPEFAHVATVGNDEYYLVVTVGGLGTEGPSGHYDP